jgi:TPR repeat protein
MAMSYWTLKGFPDAMKPDPVAALAWAKLAADGEHRPVDPVAIYRLARFYEEGVGSENVDLEEAEKLYSQAAGLGHAKSKARLIALQKSNKKSKKISISHCIIQ